MIYITGHTFTFTGYKPPVKNIQEQMFLNQRRAKTDMFDSRFILGHTYRISRIQKIIIDNTPKVEYLFTDLSESHPDINVCLSDTAAGDDYIAALHGNTLKLTEERNNIQKVLDSNTDF